MSYIKLSYSHFIIPILYCRINPYKVTYDKATYNTTQRSIFEATEELCVFRSTLIPIAIGTLNYRQDNIKKKHVNIIEILLEMILIHFGLNVIISIVRSCVVLIHEQYKAIKNFVSDIKALNTHPISLAG